MPRSRVLPIRAPLSSVGTPDREVRPAGSGGPRGLSDASRGAIFGQSAFGRCGHGPTSLEAEPMDSTLQIHGLAGALPTEAVRCGAVRTALDAHAARGIDSDAE